MEIVMKKPTVPGAEKPGGERPPVYRGKPGPQGPAGTIEIAQVVTIEPSDPARVENIGDSTNAKLILYIPKGDPGNRGEPGPAVEITEDIIQAITNELDLTPDLVGLGNVDNTSDMDKPVSNAQAAAIAQVQSNVDNHVADTNNPHGVTRQQIGAAPSGFGLGATNGKMCSDCNTAVEIGFYALDGDNCANAPTKASIQYGTMIVARRYNAVEQFAYYNKYMAIRHSGDAGATWGEWDYINPVVGLGTECRTAERWNGNPVYTKLINFGRMPNATEATVTWGASEGAVGKVVRFAATTDQGDVLPYITSTSEYTIAVAVNSITIKTNRDKSAVNAYVQVWYTKN